MFSFLDEFKDHLRKLRELLPTLATYFRAMALVEVYAGMVKDVETRGAHHREVLRVPEYVDLLREHLYRYGADHIRLDTNRIWNEEFVGTIDHLEAWQAAGHATLRTDTNHARRKHIWKSIWEGTTAVVRVKRTATRRGTSVVFWQNVTFRPRYQQHPYDVITAEEVVRKRHEEYEGTVRYIPFWLPLEYGTGRVPGGRAGGGYPAVGGFHFISTAEQRIPRTLTKYTQLLERYLADVLTADDAAPTLDHAEAWLKRHVTLGDMSETTLDVFRLAREVTGAWRTTS